ncbi:MAG: hypothetical protein PVI40_06020 [Chlamydiota bacterium]|jgi:hypothetical protein
MANSINSSLFNIGNNLPDLVRVNVLSHLSYIDQIAMRGMNSQWLQASQTRLGKLNLIRSIQKISLHDISELSPQHINNLLKVLSQLSAQPDLDPNNRILGGFLAKTLRYKCDCNPNQMVDFLESLTEEQRNSIYRLDFTDCSKNIHMKDHHIAKIFQLCPNLRSFHLDNAGIIGTGFTSIINTHPLRSLRLLNCPRLNDEFLGRLFSKTPYLMQIYFSGLNITGSCFTQLSPRNRITEVCLIQCLRLNEENLGHFFSFNAGFLKKLSLHQLNITGESLAQIPQKNQLEIVTLHSLSQLNEEALKDFFSNTDKLKKLSLQLLPTSGEALTNLPSIQQLEDLKLNNCSQLDEENLRLFFLMAFSLKTLTIESLNITGESLATFPVNNQLKILQIMTCTNLEEIHLRHFFSHTSILQAIKLSSTNVSGTCFADFPEQNRLKAFHMSNDMFNVKSELDEASLSLFFSRVSKLKEFRLFGSKTNGFGLSHIPNGNQLEKVTLGSCTNLKEEHLKEFYAKLNKINEINLMSLTTTGSELTHLPATNTLTKISLLACTNMNLDLLRVFPPKILNYDRTTGGNFNLLKSSLLTILQNGRLSGVENR